MKVLCYLPDSPAFQNKLGMLVRSAGVDFQPCSSQEDAKLFATMEKEQNFFIFCDSRKSNFLLDFAKNFKKSNIIVILQDSIEHIAPQFADLANIQCFVASHNGEFEAFELLLLLKKFQSKGVHGLEKYLGFPCIFNEKKIKNPSEKRQALTLLEGFVLKLGGDSERSHEYAQKVCGLADELILNAIFTANPKMQSFDRNYAFHLENGETIKVKWGFDGENFGLSVSDPFGSLTKQAVLGYLDQSSGLGRLDRKFGAGLGIKLIFERLHHFIVNVHWRKKTEIICLMRFERRFKDFHNRLRSFHYFSDEGSKNP